MWTEPKASRPAAGRIFPGWGGFRSAISRYWSLPGWRWCGGWYGDDGVAEKDISLCRENRWFC